jgi:hypothetical protein
MSIKIYEAYKFVVNPSIHDVYKFLQPIKKAVVAHYSSIASDPDIGKLYSDQANFKKLFAENGYRSVNESAVIYPHKTGTYIQFFLSREFHPLYEKKKKVITDFHFQNQADEPTNIPKKEWKAREKIWEEIFNDYKQTPSESGLLYEFINFKQFDMMVFLNGVKSAAALADKKREAEAK